MASRKGFGDLASPMKDHQGNAGAYPTSPVSVVIAAAVTTELGVSASIVARTGKLSERDILRFTPADASSGFFLF